MKLASLPLLIVCGVLYAQPVAFVDLSVTPQTPRLYGRVSFSNQGGGCYDCPKNAQQERPWTEPTLRARIERLDNGPAAGRGTVEVLLTNTGKTVVRIPIGLETAGLLAPPTPLRRL